MSRILHLGLGRFHRAHQAVYFSRLGPEWTISAWSLRDPSAADSFPKDGYEVRVAGQPPERIRSIVETGFVGRDHERWQKAWLDPDLQLVTLTVTEKGYAPPLFALLAEGLRRRRAAQLPPLTLLSCDNLRGNGRCLAEGLSAQGVQACCPSTVVDRIVPAGDDPKVIWTEPYCQWVIERDWAGSPPPLQRVGVIWVERIEPYEEMKLGLLNLGHSWLAYAGLLQGYRFVHEAMQDARLAAGLEQVQAEAAAQLSGLDWKEKAAYAAAVRQRFHNSDPPHALAQIAVDGSQKLPQRLFPLLRRAQENGQSHQALEGVLQAWLEFARTGPVQDPIEPIVKDWRHLPDFCLRVRQMLESSNYGPSSR